MECTHEYGCNADAALFSKVAANMRGLDIRWQSLVYTYVCRSTQEKGQTCICSKSLVLEIKLDLNCHAVP